MELQLDKKRKKGRRTLPRVNIEDQCAIGMRRKEGRKRNNRASTLEMNITCEL
jgi:hypothetical protein